jgi:hypothetical protein
VTGAGKRFHSLMPSDGAREKGELIKVHEKEGFIEMIFFLF